MGVVLVMWSSGNDLTFGRNCDMELICKGIFYAECWVLKRLEISVLLVHFSHVQLQILRYDMLHLLLLIWMKNWWAFSVFWKTILGLSIQYLKCPWHEIFYYLIRKSFQNDEEWRLFYCDSTLGCRVIQDFDLFIIWKALSNKRIKKIVS